MKVRYLALLMSLTLAGCATTSERGTLAELEDVKLVLKDEKIDDGLEKAMQSYRQFLKETPKSALTPEAIRRIADLSIEKEYGYVADGDAGQKPAVEAERGGVSAPELDKPMTSSVVAGAVDDASSEAIKAGKIATVGGGESEKEFERRAAQGERIPARETGK
ncbi:MAG: hypothetical protein OEZ16_11575, partial [Chromatiales bacterium]|nr:hypothetical protein [Chromatiales bacterium]